MLAFPQRSVNYLLYCKFNSKLFITEKKNVKAFCWAKSCALTLTRALTMEFLVRPFHTSSSNPQTTSSKFTAEETRFRGVQKAARALVEHVANVVDAVRARHAAELLIAEALEDIFPWAPEAPRVKEVTLETCNRLLQQFVSRSTCLKGREM